MAANAREKVYNTLTSPGFNHVAIDLGGYRTDSMNETLARG